MACEEKLNDEDHEPMEWILLFRQTFSMQSKIHNKPWPRNTLQLNADDPSAANYAVLHKVEKYRNPFDGKFEFKLFWPNHAEKKSQHWKQSTNPANVDSTGNVNNGYEAIEIHHTYAKWQGLEWTGTHCANGNTCLMNGAPGSNFFYWYALGIYDQGYQGGISGPDGSSVDKVELWVRAPLVSQGKVRKLEQTIKALRLQSIDEEKYLQWNSDQVCDWVISLDEAYRRYEQVLRVKLKQQDVDGSVLTKLDANMWLPLGIESVKHRFKIIENVERLKQKQKHVEGPSGEGVIDTLI